MSTAVERAEHAAYVRVWRARNVERARENDRRWRAAHPETVHASRRVDYERHADKYRANAHRWREANVERARARESAWRRGHPEEMRHYRAAYQAKRRGALIADLTFAEWRDLLTAYGNRCAYCRHDGVPLEREHVIPVHRGGNHTKPNVVPSCRSCNARKARATANGLEWPAPSTRPYGR